MSVLAVIGTYQHRIDTIVCFSEGWKSGFVLCKLNKVQACTPPSFPFFFWAVWASGNDALKSEMTAQIPIRLLTDFLCSQKHSKVSFELPEGFSVTAEKWQQQGMFWVTQNLASYSRKPCRRGASPKSGNLFQPYGNCVLFLALDAVLFHLAV